MRDLRSHGSIIFFFSSARASNFSFSVLLAKVTHENGRVLVHCVAGVSRSATLCLAYFIKYGGMSLREAFAYVVKRRPCIRPNNTFFKQLIDFEIENRGTASVSFVFDKYTKTYIPDVYERKFEDKSCCQMNFCQKRHCGMH